MFELFNILKNSINSEVAREVLDGIYKNQKMSVIASDIHEDQQALQYTCWHKAKFPRINILLVDAVQIYLAQKMESKLSTLDQEMHKYPNCVGLNDL